mgnify:CR=1 FL=1
MDLLGLDVLRLVAEQKKKDDQLLSEVKVNAYLSFLKQQNAHEVQGIFRVSGRASHVQQVRDQVDHNFPIKIDVDMDSFVHTVATALKGYLTSSEVSVVPPKLYEVFLAVMSMLLLFYQLQMPDCAIQTQRKMRELFI